MADPNFNVPSDIDLLLGADVYYSIVCGEIIRLQDKFLTLINTELGYVIGGSIPSQVVCNFVNNKLTSSCQDLCFFTETSLEEKIERFWNIKNLFCNE